MRKHWGAGVLAIVVLAIAIGTSATAVRAQTSDAGDGSFTVASRGTRDPSKPIPWVAPRPDSRTRST